MQHVLKAPALVLVAPAQTGSGLVGTPALATGSRGSDCARTLVPARGSAAEVMPAHVATSGFAAEVMPVVALGSQIGAAREAYPVSALAARIGGASEVLVAY